MKSKRLYYAYLIGFLIILPIVNSVSVIAQGANYIGIDENDEFIWNLTYDEDIDEELGDDLGLNTTYFSVDDEIKALRHVITWIGEEDKHGGDKGVKYKRNRYDSKKRGNQFGQGYDWKMDDEGGEFVILKYESDDDSVIDYYIFCAMWGAFYTATNVDWSKVVREYNDDVKGDGHASYINNRITFHISEQDYDYYAEGYEIEDVDIWCEYTSDGILENYRFDYGEETIITLELVNAFWIQYWLYIILGIIALGAIVVIVVYFSFIYQKKPKEVAPSAPAPAVAPPPVEKTPEPQKIEEKPGKGVFCPYCGSSNTAGSNFCEYCGKNLEE